LVEEWKPDRLLVGQPLNMDGTPSEMMKKVNNFYIKLQAETKIACELVDERLTSFEAKQLLEPDSKSTRIDDLAAKIFLDNWMEHNVDS
jgi:putative Holliday junction resolvase